MKSVFGSCCLFILMIGFAGCKKDLGADIPNVSFNASIYLNNPAYINNPFIVKVDDSGQRIGTYGVIVYRQSATEYLVFDLMCPHELSATCLVQAKDGATAECPCCQSRFIIATSPSSLVKGPAVWPLKSYQSSVSYSGDYLSIFN